MGPWVWLLTHPEGSVRPMQEISQDMVYNPLVTHVGGEGGEEHFISDIV